jgi:hypothetical protein
MANARGKYAYGICDRTGFRYKLNELVYEVVNGVKTGLRVGRDVFDPDQPQNFIGRVRTNDPQSLSNPRPDRTEPATTNQLGNNPFKTGTPGATTDITVTEINHGRDTGDTVRFRNADTFAGISKSVIELSAGYTITKVDANTYTVTVSATASAADVIGGGALASAGPVTLSA